MHRLILVLVLLLLGQFGYAQANCGCDGIDMTWLEEVKDNITEEILNPIVTPCGSTEGSIKQCTYLGQTVFTYLPSTLPCDVPFSVVDCSGNLVFSYGGFCQGPCPGDDQVQFLENCEEIYSVPANLICDNSCEGTSAVLLEIGCVNTGIGVSSVCVPITTTNFTDIVSFQTGIAWDPTILFFTGINEVSLTGTTVNGTNILNGELRFLWLLPFGGTPLDLLDDAVLFEICFDIIGPTGSMSAIELVSLTNFMLEVANSSGMVEPTCQEVGTVNIGTADITLDNNPLEVNFCGFISIPTLGEWGLIMLGIILLICGVMFLKATSTERQATVQIK